MPPKKEEVKTCSRCKIPQVVDRVYSYNSGFSKNSRKLDGLQDECKACHSRYQTKAYALKHRQPVPPDRRPDERLIRWPDGIDPQATQALEVEEPEEIQEESPESTPTQEEEEYDLLNAEPGAMVVPSTTTSPAPIPVHQVQKTDNGLVAELSAMVNFALPQLEAYKADNAKLNRELGTLQANYDSLEREKTATDFAHAQLGAQISGKDAFIRALTQSLEDSEVARKALAAEYAEFTTETSDEIEALKARVEELESREPAAPAVDIESMRAALSSHGYAGT
jgi:hypothetical protein